MITLLLSFITGILFILTAEVFIIRLWFHKQQLLSPSVPYDSDHDWDGVKRFIEKITHRAGTSDSSANPASFLNIISLFLFQELKGDAKVRSQVLSRVNIEISEILMSKLKSTIIKSMSVHNFSAGSSPPQFKNINISKVRLCHETRQFRKLHVAFDVEYSGSGKLALQGTTVLGKTLYVSVEIKKLVGKVIVIFNRDPQTHWGFCFDSEPEIELNVVSSFQQRTLPHLARVITTILRRTIRKKHTKPIYKRRYAPFFKEPKVPLPSGKQILVSRQPLTSGKILVKVISANRIVKMQNKSPAMFFCTVSLGAKEWDASCCPLKQHLVFDSLIEGVDDGIGLKFSTDTEETGLGGVIVEDIHKNSPAHGSMVRQGDLVTAINNKRITNFKSALTASLSSANKAKLSIKRPLLRFNKLFSSGTASQDLAGFQQDTSREPSFVEDDEFLILDDYLKEDDLSESELDESRNISDVFTDLEIPCVNEEDPVLRTQSVDTSLEPTWDEYFLLDIEEGHQFLSLCLWREETVYSRWSGYNPVLVGSCNLNLADLTLQCLSTASSTFSQAVFMNLPSELKWQENIVGPVGSLPHVLPKMKTIAGELKLEQTHCVSDPESCLHSFVPGQTHSSSKCGSCTKRTSHRNVYLCVLCGTVRHERCLHPTTSTPTRRHTASAQSRSRFSFLRHRSNTCASPSDPPQEGSSPGVGRSTSSFSFLRGAEKRAALQDSRLEEVERDLEQQVALRKKLLEVKARCQQVPPGIVQKLAENDGKIRDLITTKEQLGY